MVFSSGFDDGAEKQKGVAFCPLNFSTSKKVRLKVWGNTERQDAPYDIAEVKLIKLETGSCPRNFITKKCEEGPPENHFWIDCPDAPLGMYEQCCSPLLAINSTLDDNVQYIDKGDWQLGMSTDSQGWSTLTLDCAYGPGPEEKYAIHPNLTLACPKATVLGLGQEAGGDVLGTCDVEITKFRRCPEEDRPDYWPDDWVSRPEPLAVFLRKGETKPFPDQITYPGHQYRVCSKTIVWDIFCVENVQEFASMADFPADPTGSAFYVAGGKVYMKRADYTPQGQNQGDQYMLIGDYNPNVVQWYAAVVVLLIPSAGPPNEGGPGGFTFFPIPAQGDFLLYYAPLTCGTNGKPIGKIPDPPGGWAEVTLYDGTDVTGEFVFPTMTLYRPGAGVPTNGDGKSPSTGLPPEWCGIEQCKSENCDCDDPRPFSALGLECGCDKNCMVSNVIARVGMAGSDEDIPCETRDHFMCRIFEVPAGNYYVAFTTDTVDQLHHTDMQHHFSVEWCNIDDDTLTCSECSSSSNSSISA